MSDILQIKNLKFYVKLLKDPAGNLLFDILSAAVSEEIQISVSSHLYNILLAGFVLGRPFYWATPHIHSELWFGLTASKLEGESK